MWNKSLKKFRSERDTSNTSAVLCQLSYQANWELVIQTSNLMVSYPFTALLIHVALCMPIWCAQYVMKVKGPWSKPDLSCITNLQMLYHPIRPQNGSLWQPLNTSTNLPCYMTLLPYIAIVMNVFSNKFRNCNFMLTHHPISSKPISITLGLLRAARELHCILQE